MIVFLHVTSNVEMSKRICLTHVSLRQLSPGHNAMCHWGYYEHFGIIISLSPKFRWPKIRQESYFSQKWLCFYNYNLMSSNDSQHFSQYSVAILLLPMWIGSSRTRHLLSHKYALAIITFSWAPQSNYQINCHFCCRSWCHNRSITVSHCPW